MIDDSKQTAEPPAPELPHFTPSPHWGKPLWCPTSLDITPAAPEAYEAALAGLASFAGDVEELFRTQRPGTNNLKSFDSLYLGKSGTFYLLHPHTHDVTAGRVIGSVHPGIRPPGVAKKYAKGGGWTHSDLTLLSGIQRIQIRGNGVGVTVEMGHPPNRTQLDAVRAAYSMTPMQLFVVEIDRGGHTLFTLGSFDDLVDLVNHWDPEQPEEMFQQWPQLAGLFDGPGAEE